MSIERLSRHSLGDGGSNIDDTSLCLIICRIKLRANSQDLRAAPTINHEYKD